MGTLLFQQRWFKPKRHKNSSKSEQKDQVRKRSSLLVGLSLKIYLQFLLTIGLFQSKRTWVDKQIKWCYNVFDKLEIPYKKWY